MSAMTSKYFPLSLACGLLYGFSPCFHSLIVVPIVIVYYQKFFSAIVEASHEKKASHADEWLGECSLFVGNYCKERYQHFDTFHGRKMLILLNNARLKFIVHS